jgi:hypothetical protein
MLRVALEEGSHFTEEENTVIRQDARKNPDKYKQWKPLPYWRQEVNLEKYLEIPMHLLFLNVAKSVMLLVVDWATIRFEKARLHRLLSNLIKTSYFRNMAWLKLLPLGNDMTFGGWVLENYLALVRISPWVMLPVRSWEEVTEYRDPDGSPKDWTRSQLRKFLRQSRIKARVLIPVRD